jgi:two-component system, cell cycle sensor histidine kinase and response regulator CckA
VPHASPDLSVAAFPILFESAPDGIVIVNREGRIVLVNSQAEKLFGYERTELVSQPSEFLVPARFRERHRKYRTNLISDPKSQPAGTGLELYGLRKDATEFQAKISFTPVQTKDGLLVYTVIRASQAKVEALRASEVRFRRLFETAKDAMLLLDASTGQVRDVNRFLIEMLGYSHEEYLGQKLWETGPFKNNEALQTAFQELQRKPHIRYEDLPLQTKNGNPINAELVGNVYRVNRDRVIQCVIRDITERKRAEGALRLSEERYRAIFEQDLASDYISTADGKFLACNPSFARMFGFLTVEEAKEAGLKSLYPNPNAYELFLRCLKEQKKLVGYEEELRRRDGTTLHVVARVIGVFDQSEELVEIHAYLIDESERRQTEQQIRQAQKMDAMGRLAGGVAHDFNNLLGIIIGQSEILSNQAGCADSTRKGLAEIGKAADRGAALTRQLLAFTRQQVLEPRVLDLNGIVTETNKMVGRLIGENIELVMNLHADLERVKADPNQIVQVILNLVVNSRDAMPGGGKLTIETSNLEIDDAADQSGTGQRPGHYVALRVIDTGTGMDKETLSHIFEPFFSTKGIGMGTGLGLATVHGIVTQSDGQISVQSEPGLGTTIEILLPRVKEEISELSAPVPRVTRGSETILLVEDSIDLRNVVRQFLEIDGYKVLGAGDATQAMQVAKQYAGPIHLILTDVVLPGVSGRILAEQLMGVRPEANVLFMSGYTDDTVLYHQVSQAALNFIQKPFTRSNLVSKVRHVLDDTQARATIAGKLLSV